jgi:hypothetical protein
LNSLKDTNTTILPPVLLPPSPRKTPRN